MKTTIAVIALLAIAASAATYVRYRSFNPCDWMARDLANESHQPGSVIEARIRAAFLLNGIVNPSPVDCIQAWWKFRADDLPEKS
jgi:hypothetical protein